MEAVCCHKVKVTLEFEGKIKEVLSFVYLKIKKKKIFVNY